MRFAAVQAAVISAGILGALAFLAFLFHLSGPFQVGALVFGLLVLALGLWYPVPAPSSTPHDSPEAPSRPSCEEV